MATSNAKKELKTLVYKIELLRSKIEEKRDILAFENTFFLPLFVLLLFVSYSTMLNEVKIFLFMLTVLLIIIDLLYSFSLYSKIKRKQKDLEVMIKKRLEIT